MHLKSKEIAYTGLMAAITVVCIILGSVIETNTLFLLAIASFFCGLVMQITSKRLAGGYVLACFLLGLLIAPNKLYCFTYLGMALYVYGAQVLHQRVVDGKIGMLVCWAGKCVLYHVLLIVSLVAVWRVLGFSQLLQSQWIQRLTGMPWVAVIVILLCAEALWLLFDKAYRVFFLTTKKYIQRF